MAEDNGEPKLSDELRLGNPFPPDCPPPEGLIISGGTRRTPCWQGWKKPGFFKKKQPSGFFVFFKDFGVFCFFFILGYLGFLVFFWFLKNIFAQKREFLGFIQF
jgi:hypothetical protein